MAIKHTHQTKPDLNVVSQVVDLKAGKAIEIIAVCMTVGLFSGVMGAAGEDNGFMIAFLDGKSRLLKETDAKAPDIQTPFRCIVTAYWHGDQMPEQLKKALVEIGFKP